MKETYIPVIGLEIHAELKTRTKMFCDCLNDPQENTPNKNICPVCMGHPGALPVMNKEAIESMIKIGMALNGEIPATSKFDRKHYFYPDLPKGYQISQYDIPFVFGGTLNGVAITRVHLEEDAAKNLHSTEDGEQMSLVDYNRAGVPLMELVTEPVIRSAKDAGDFARELQLLLRYLNVSDADMEKGQMRVEVNLSLGKLEAGELKLGTKVEVKNINSFKAAEAAAEYEIKRQQEVLAMGEKIVQETRGWDDVKKITFSQRSKEEANDYRYFPDPDLPAIDLSQFDFAALRNEIPELPQAKRARFVQEYGLSLAQLDVLIPDQALADYFEAAVSELAEEVGTENWKKHVQTLLNYLTSDFRGLMLSEGALKPEQTKVTAENFADLVILVDSDKVTSRVAKDILRVMYETGGDPNVILKEQGLEQVSDAGELEPLAKKIIAENPGPVEQYKAGKETVLMFFVGAAMKELRGKGNPQVLAELFKRLLA